jgi:uncharacterized protein YbaR (Trm112 family)
MFIEHLDQLRCTSDHEDSWLIASFQRREERYVLDATLGCHVCHREYPIVNGVAYFGVRPPVAQHLVATADPDSAFRVAAFLNVREGATIVLGGAWGSVAHDVGALMPLRVFALNPASEIGDSEQVSTIRSSEGIPLTPGSVHGVALDLQTATDVNLRTALRVLAPAGRIVLPAHVPVPAEIHELARDAHDVVGEVAPAMIPLQRRTPSAG